MLAEDQMIEEILESGLILTEREETFLDDISHREHLTDKQSDWLYRIYEKAKKAAGWEDVE